METISNSKTQTNHPVSLTKAMLIGGGVGLMVISFFVFGVDNSSPAWPKLWFIRPLVVTPLAGAMGGAFYCLMDHLSSRGLNRTVAVILSLVVFLIGLWLGIVLGLDSTMWD